MTIEPRNAVRINDIRLMRECSKQQAARAELVERLDRALNQLDFEVTPLAAFQTLTEVVKELVNAISE